MATKTTTRPAKTAAKKTAPAKKAPAKRTPPAQKAAPASRTVKAGWRTDPDQPLLKRYWDGEAFVGGALPADKVDAKTPAPDPEQRVQDTIVFRDRAMVVRMPTGDQLGVWERSIAALDTIGPLATANGTPEQRGKVLKLNTRLQSIVASVLVDDDDKGWLDDRFLDESLDLSGASDILQLTFAAFDLRFGGKAKAPTTGPVARRRRA